MKTSPLLVALALATAAGAQDLPVPPSADPVPLPAPADWRLCDTLRELLARLAATREVTWTGTVVDAAGQRLPGADVWIYPDGPTLRAMGWQPRQHVRFTGLGSPDPILLDEAPFAALPHAITDAQGGFTLGLSLHQEPARGLLGLGEAAGLPVLVISKPDFATRIAAKLSDGSAASIDLGTLALAPAAEAVGRVVDADGAPIAGALVRPGYQNVLEPWSTRCRGGGGGTSVPSQTARTGADGSFRLEGLWPGQLSLIVDHPDHPLAGAQGLVLKVGESCRVPDIVLQTGFELNGVVLDAEGRAVSAARVASAGQVVSQYGLGCVVGGFGRDDDTLPTRILGSFRIGSRDVRADESGHFVLSGVGAGAQTIFVSAPGFETASLDGVTAPRNDLRVVLTPQASLILHVRGEDGAPIAGLALRAVRRQAPHEQYGTSTETDEILELRPVAGEAGTWRVPGAGPVATEIFAACEGWAMSSTLVPGCKPGERRELSITLRRDRGIGGRVLDPGGAPVPGARLTLRVPDMAWSPELLRTTGDQDGRFRFQGVPVALFDLAVEAPGCEPLLLPYVSTGAAADLSLELKPGCGVAIHVLDAFGQPVGGRQVVLQRPGSGQDRETPWVDRARFGSTDAEGFVRWDSLPGGRWSFKVVSGPTRELDLAAGESRMCELALEELRRVEGVVMCAGVPVPGASVSVQGRDSGGHELEPRMHQADAAGHFEILIAGAASCRVQARSSRPPWDTWKQLLAEAPFDVDLSRPEARSLRLELPAASVSGRVLRAGGKSGVPDRTIVLRRGSLVWAQQSCDEQGGFVFTNVAAGSYVLDLEERGPFVAVQGEAFEVPADAGAIHRSLELPAGARLHGRIRDVRGAPAPDGCSITAFRLDSEKGAGWARSSGGQWELSDLEAGTYVISARLPGIDADGGEKARVTVEPGDAAEVNLVVEDSPKPAR